VERYPDLLEFVGLCDVNPKRTIAAGHEEWYSSMVAAIVQRYISEGSNLSRLARFC
jgi:hypothetical protein